MRSELPTRIANHRDTEDTEKKLFVFLCVLCVSVVRKLVTAPGVFLARRRLGPTAAQFLHAPPYFRLEAALDRLIIMPRLRQIILRHPAVGVVVTVLVAFAVAELFGSFVVCIAQ